MYVFVRARVYYILTVCMLDTSIIQFKEKNLINLKSHN